MSSALHLALLDVGHGSSAVLYDESSAIVFDCPPGTVLLKFLRGRGITRVLDLVLSHADKDHIGGVDVLVSSGIQVERVWVNSDQTNRTGAYERLCQLCADARGMGNTTLRRRHPDTDQDPIRWEDIEVEWLGPNPEDRMVEGDRNSLSVVARVVRAGRGVAVFPGDLDLRGYERLSTAKDWTCDWLIAPHHGGRTGLKRDESELLSRLLDRTGAQEVFFSIGRTKFSLPRPEVVRAAIGRAAVRCSQLSMHCMDHLPIERDNHGWVAAGARNNPLSCCSGTIVVAVTDEGSTWEGATRHDQFVSAFDGRLCAPLTPSP